MKRGDGRDRPEYFIKTTILFFIIMIFMRNPAASSCGSEIRPLNNIGEFFIMIETMSAENQQSQQNNEINFVSGYWVERQPPTISDENALTRNTWLRECESSGIDINRMLERGVEETRKAFIFLRKYEALAGRENAVNGLTTGRCLLTLKPLVMKAGFKWGVWAEQNLSFIPVRNRQKLILIAETPRSAEYGFLGLERLYIVCAAAKKVAKGESDPIGTFCSRHDIQFDREQDFDLDEFKKQIDTACRRGKKAKTAKEEPMLDFNSLGSKLCDTIDYVLGDKAQLESISEEILCALVERLKLIEAAITAAEETTT